MKPVLFNITQGTSDLTWFVVASLSILAVGAVLVILLIKLLNRINK